MEGSDDKNPSHVTAAFLANAEERAANSNGQVQSGDMFDVHREQLDVYQMYVCMCFILIFIYLYSSPTLVFVFLIVNK